MLRWIWQIVDFAEDWFDWDFLDIFDWGDDDDDDRGRRRDRRRRSRREELEAEIEEYRFEKNNEAAGTEEDASETLQDRATGRNRRSSL
jgi:hypothetical protein